MEAMRSGTPPEKPLLESGTVSLAGVLFMIPGFISDAVALFLLIPSVRDLIWQGLAYGFRGRAPTRRGPQARTGPDVKQPQQQKPERAEDVIDVEFTEVPRGEGSGGSSAERADSPWGKPQ
jgi:UPF0716 protein FxsA